MNRYNLKLIIFGVVGLFAFILLSVLWPFTVVGTGERGVVTHFGKVQPEVLDEGIHFRMPIVTSVHKISVQVHKSDIKTEAASKDLQSVHTEFNINWHPTVSEVNQMYQEIGDETDVVEKIIAPAVSEVLKSSTAKRTAEEIISKRLDLKEEIDKALISRVAKYHVVIKDVNLVDLTFSTEFNKAIEEKQIAEQESLKAQYTANKAKKDAEAAYNTADGQARSALRVAQAQAESQKLLKLTITPEILQLKAIEKWDGGMPQFLGGANGGMLFNIPVTAKTKSAAKTQTTEEESSQE